MTGAIALKLSLSLLLCLALLPSPGHAHRLDQPAFEPQRLDSSTLQFVDQTSDKILKHQQYFQNRNPQLEIFVNRLRDKIIDAPGNLKFFRNLDIRVLVFNNGIIQAEALADGHILFNSGVLLAMENEEAVSAILAHEMAHIVRGHTYRIVDAVGIPTEYHSPGGIGSALPDMRGVRIRQTWEGLKGNLYSRRFEYEADHLALELLNNSKTDPLSLPRALMRTETFDGSAFNSNPGLIGRLMNACGSHPLTCDRIDSTLKEIKGHRYEWAGKVAKAPLTDFLAMVKLAKAAL